MRASHVEFGAAVGAAPAGAGRDPVRRLAEVLPRPLRFLDVGGHHAADEAMRYAAVAASAQAVSYGVFAGLIVTALASLPQLAVVAGSAAGAIVSYSGQALFAFRPSKPTA